MKEHKYVKETQQPTQLDFGEYQEAVDTAFNKYKRVPNHRFLLFGIEFEFIDGLYYVSTGLIKIGAQFGEKSLT